MTALTSLAPWAPIALVALVLIFILILVGLVLIKKQPGDQVIVHVFPPKIEIRSEIDQKRRTLEGETPSQSDSA